MSFPTAHSNVYYNEAGEPMGWDNSIYADDGPSIYDVDDLHLTCDDGDDS